MHYLGIYGFVLVHYIYQTVKSTNSRSKSSCIRVAGRPGGWLNSHVTKVSLKYNLAVLIVKNNTILYLRVYFHSFRMQNNHDIVFKICETYTQFKKIIVECVFLFLYLFFSSELQFVHKVALNKLTRAESFIQSPVYIFQGQLF